MFRTILIGVLLIGCSCTDDKTDNKSSDKICVDEYGNDHALGEHWTCADGCNRCTCRASGDRVSIWSTEINCPDTDQIQSNLETEPILETEPKSLVVNAVWEDIEFQQMENCQRVNTGHDIIHKWSADDDYVAFTNNDDSQFSLVDIAKRKILKLPNLDRNQPFGICNQCTSIIYMQIYKKNLYFTTLSYTQNMAVESLVRYDIANHTYYILDTINTEVRYNAIHYTYSYFRTDGRHVVAWDGCGVDAFNPSWCLIDLQNMNKQQLSKNGRQAFIFNGLVLSVEGTLQTDIIYLDIASDRKVEVTRDDYYQVWPHTDGQRIVYMDLRYNKDKYPLNTYSNAVIMLYDLQTQETRQLTNEKWISAFPQIKNDRVTWFDYENIAGAPIDAERGVEIHELDLVTNETRAIVQMPNVNKIEYHYQGDSIVLFGERSYISDLLYCPISRE